MTSGDGPRRPPDGRAGGASGEAPGGRFRRLPGPLGPAGEGGGPPRSSATRGRPCRPRVRARPRAGGRGLPLEVRPAVGVFTRCPASRRGAPIRGGPPPAPSPRADVAGRRRFQGASAFIHRPSPRRTGASPFPPRAGGGSLASLIMPLYPPPARLRRGPSPDGPHNAPHRTPPPPPRPVGAYSIELTHYDSSFSSGSSRGAPRRPASGAGRPPGLRPPRGALSPSPRSSTTAAGSPSRATGPTTSSC